MKAYTLLMALLICGHLSTKAATYSDDFNREDTAYSTNSSGIGSGWVHSRANMESAIQGNELSLDIPATESANFLLYNSNHQTLNADANSFFEMTADVMIPGSSVYGGVAFNIQDANNFYLLRIKTNSGQYQLLRVVNGNLGVLLSATDASTFSAGTWYTFTVFSSTPYHFDFTITEAGSSTVINTTTSASDSGSNFVDGYGGFYHWSGLISQSPDAFYDNFTVEVEPMPSFHHYALWVAKYPTLGSETNYTDDPDLDSINNLFEYGLGGIPTNSDAANISPTYCMVEEGGLNWMYYTYNRRLDATERQLTYSVVSDIDLVAGSMTNTTEEIGSSEIDAEFESVTNRLSVDAESQQFMTLKIGLQGFDDFKAVESLLPAYLNRDTAVITFYSYSTNALNLTVSFIEKDTGQIPCSPIGVQIPKWAGLYPLEIDISEWLDGDYEATITGLGTGTDLIRGIRKQTIAGPSAPSEPISVDNEDMLFVDDFYLDSYQNLEFEPHQAELLHAAPWEQEPGLKRWINSLRDFWFNLDGSTSFRIIGYYTTSDPNPIDYIATTSDYETWSITINSGSLAATQNVIPLATTDTYRFYDPLIDGDVDLSEVDIVYTGISGCTWGSFNMPSRSVYAIWRKPTENVILQPQYEPITQDKLEWDDDDIGDWSDTNDNFGSARLYDNNTVIRFYQARRIPRWDPYRIHYDNIWSSRIMVTWSSTDGIEWTPTYFSVPTEQDPVGYQHYRVDIFNAGLNLEMGYLLMYDQALQKLSTEIVYGRNGLLWNRFENGKFLANGETPGDWNFGYCMVSGNRTRKENAGYYYEPVNGINVLHFMFLHSHNLPDRNIITVSRFKTWLDGRLTGVNGIESSPIWDWYNGSWDNIVSHAKEQMWTPGLMKYRSDGWVSTGPADTGQDAIFTTKQLTSSGTLAINAKTDPGGYIKVEVLDANGDPLSDYCGVNAALFTGDSVGTNLTWKSGTIAQPPTASAYKLKVTISNGDLYAFYW